MKICGSRSIFAVPLTFLRSSDTMQAWSTITVDLYGPLRGIMKHLPDIDLLNELLSYNPITGLVHRKCDIGKRHKAGELVGSDAQGWLRMCINGEYYLLHRIVWYMHTGNDPYPYEIDHINRVRTDNRIDNLRLVTLKENSKNKSLYNTNRSGYPGVFKRGNRYMAQYKLDGVKHYVGTYDDAYQAHLAIVEHRGLQSIQSSIY